MWTCHSLLARVLPCHGRGGCCAMRRRICRVAPTCVTPGSVWAARCPIRFYLLHSMVISLLLVLFVQLSPCFWRPCCLQCAPLGRRTARRGANGTLGSTLLQSSPTPACLHYSCCATGSC